MIKGKRLPVEVRLSCLQLELQAPVLLLFHLFLIILAFLTPQGANVISELLCNDGFDFVC